MSVAWGGYALVVGALLAITAVALERAARLAGRPVRWVWAGALGLTVAIVMAAPRRFADQGGAASVAYRVVEYGATPYRHAPTIVERIAMGIGQARAAVGASIDHALAAVDRTLPHWVGASLAAGWLALTIIVVLSFALVYLRFRRARTQWPVARLQGTPVRVAPAAGPAVIGVAHPEIVVPHWLLGRSADEQRLVLAHESEHLAARDPLLLAFGCVAVVLLPWHPAVWWMLSRLRLAVELDCDARVLRRGATPRSYGTLLIDLAGQCSGFRLGGAIALADESSHLERRLLAMHTDTPRLAPVRASLLAGAAALALLVACEAKLPTSTDVANMNVASAEAGARKVSLLGPGDSAETYIIDGKTVTAAEARALSPEQIASVEVTKTDGTPGHQSTVSIRTRKAGDAAGPHDVMFKVRGDTLENGARGAHVATMRKFSGIVLLDGVRVDEGTINSIPPQDIVSVEVVKGPAATKLYDAPEAANGVIRITTKQGAAKKE